MLSQEKVVTNHAMGPAHNGQGLYKLVLHGQIAEHAYPGQFVAIRPSDTNDPLLRRPLSIAGIDKKTGELTLCYRLKGPGTTLLSRIPPGAYVDVLGPLGQGFSLGRQGFSKTLPDFSEDRPGFQGHPLPARVILVAGGIGIFSLYALLEHLLRNPAFWKILVTVIWGGLDKGFLEHAMADVLYQLPKENLILCTMDGSLGYKGLVTEPLEHLLNTRKTAGTLESPNRFESGGTLVAACGPKVMLHAVAELCERFGVPSEVCLEEHMACGLGACLGCSCQIKDETGVVRRGRVCVEGPVFSGKEVVWHEQI
ncbi:MAG: dihydroorotate dehydrogenase electron transfer subunit [Peptococcaceae bacterium]|nr:dihydroorotate dehydrogenase electron transfer subunit [Peptococcaceae bacterium]